MGPNVLAISTNSHRYFIDLFGPRESHQSFDQILYSIKLIELFNTLSLSLARSGLGTPFFLQFFFSPYPHRKMAAPHDSPAPNPAQAITSPFWTFPARTASSNARGMEAALVLPYSLRFVMTFSMGMPNRCATVSMMRMLAWCSNNQSTLSTVRSAASFGDVVLGCQDRQQLGEDSGQFKKVQICHCCAQGVWLLMIAARILGGQDQGGFCPMRVDLKIEVCLVVQNYKN